MQEVLSLKGTIMLNILKKHTILYVEDEKAIRDNISEYLKSYFKEVYLADNGEEALKEYYLHRPSCLLLDITIPHIDGLSVAKKIRESDEDIKIIMLTGHTEQEKLLKATELKLTKYLVKPTPPKIFKDTLKLLASELQKTTSSLIHIKDGCYWDESEQKLYVDNKEAELSVKNLLLLKLLLKKRAQTVTYEDIMVELWEDSFERDISIDSVKNQVSLLRKKLPNGCIDSIYSKGYILR